MAASNAVYWTMFSPCCTPAYLNGGWSFRAHGALIVWHGSQLSTQALAIVSAGLTQTASVVRPVVCLHETNAWARIHSFTTLRDFAIVTSSLQTYGLLDLQNTTLEIALRFHESKRNRTSGLSGIMASIPLVDTYKRYKAGTNRLVNWLAISVQELSDRANSDSQHKEYQRPAKKVTVSSLITYATRIVEARDPNIEIDVSILDVTKDAIMGRAAAASWYEELASEGANATSEHATSGLRNANDSHQHFLAVL